MMKYGSLPCAVRRLRDSAYPVRDQLSGDTWLLLGALERELLDPVPSGTAPGRLARVLTSLLALSGLTSESMVHDLGWRFMTAGRRLERAMQMLTLLRATITVSHAGAHGTALPSMRLALDAHTGLDPTEALHGFGGAVPRPVVNDHDLPRPRTGAQETRELLQRRLDPCRLVVRGNDDAEIGCLQARHSEV